MSETTTRGHNVTWRTEFNRNRAEDLAWMARWGETFAGAARRLGISVDALEKWCDRNNTAVRNQLRANEREAS